MTTRVRVLALALFTLFGGAAARAADAPEGTVFATIGKERILEADVLASVRDAADKAQRDYDRAARQLQFRERQTRERIVGEEVERRVDERVLALEATRRKTTPERLLADLPKATASDDEAHQLYLENEAQIRAPYEQVVQRIKDMLTEERDRETRRRYLAELRGRAGARVLREPLRVAVPAEGPARGAPAAPVVIVEFSDLQCPYCARLAPELARLVSEYPKDVRIVYRHLPLVTVHAHAQEAARAAVCAQRQGRFWEFHDAVFGDQADLSSEKLRTLALKAGVGGEDFESCLRDEASAAAVAADVAVADALGLAGTPATFVNGRFVDGLLPYGDLKALIEDERARVAHQAARADATR